jgi:hypothetical protein
MRKLSGAVLRCFFFFSSYLKWWLRTLRCVRSSALCVRSEFPDSASPLLCKSSQSGFRPFICLLCIPWFCCLSLRLWRFRRIRLETCLKFTDKCWIALVCVFCINTVTSLITFPVQYMTWSQLYFYGYGNLTMQSRLQDSWNMFTFQDIEIFQE